MGCYQISNVVGHAQDERSSQAMGRNRELKGARKLHHSNIISTRSGLISGWPSSNPAAAQKCEGIKSYLDCNFDIASRGLRPRYVRYGNVFTVL